MHDLRPSWKQKMVLNSQKKTSRYAAQANSSATCRPDSPIVAMEALRDPELVNWEFARSGHKRALRRSFAQKESYPSKKDRGIPRAHPPGIKKSFKRFSFLIKKVNKTRRGFVFYLNVTIIAVDDAAMFVDHVAATEPVMY